jgi:hypothetical protein
MQNWEYLEIYAYVGNQAVVVPRGKLELMTEFIRQRISNIAPKLDLAKSVKIHDAGASIEVKGINTVELLDLLGADGWSLIAIHEKRFYLKRPVGGQ